MRLLVIILSLMVVGACSPKGTSPATSTAEQSMQSPALAKRNLTFSPADTTWTEEVRKTDEEWQRILTEDEFQITRRQGTEKPYSSPLEANEAKGMYYCTCCANPLFRSETKFHSGTGWPSFWKPYASKSVAVATDNSHGMVRDEISCARCGAHLGHVFDDGPQPTGLRYCMDGFALHFVPTK